jgi:hypothetical protein
MKHKIESIINQGILPAIKSGGVVRFEEINKVSDISTTFVYDDKIPGMITFIHHDANGNFHSEEIDLAAFGLDYNYVLDKIRPVFDGEGDSEGTGFIHYFKK